MKQIIQNIHYFPCILRLICIFSLLRNFPFIIKLMDLTFLKQTRIFLFSNHRGNNIYACLKLTAFIVFVLLLSIFIPGLYFSWLFIHFMKFSCEPLRRLKLKLLFNTLITIYLYVNLCCLCFGILPVSCSLNAVLNL